MPSFDVDALAAKGQTKELRLALVCYGGVSLAIYMHGMTKEIHRLVKASKLLEAELPSRSSSENVYLGLLRRKAEDDPEGVRTRVVVDVIAGTSAGGINAVYLAKALARNLSQDELRDLWLERGDIRQLLAGPRFLPLWLKVPWLLLRFLHHAPLRGDAMSRWLFDALVDMDRGGSDPPAVPSLMPERHKLQLFVTVTDFYGYSREVPIQDPKLVHDHRHRHVLEFSYDGAGLDRFTPEDNGALAFAARTTSCFPGAFPPVSVAAFSGHLQGRDADLRRLQGFFRLYELSGAQVRLTYFIDGGVLDNKPFGHVIRGIRERPADVEVDRRLLYLEPAPGGRADPPGGEEPSTVSSILGAASGIPRREPILDDLLEVAKLNERVQRVREIVETSFVGIAKRVEAIVGDHLDQLQADVPEETLTLWRKAINEAAEQDAGFAYATYLRIKMSGVVDRYAATLCSVLDYPADSNHALVVRSVLLSWAQKKGLFAREMPPPSWQVQFLQGFDLEYAERRLRFVIAGLNWLYRDVGELQLAGRAELNAAKARLYEAVDRLLEVMSGRRYGAELKTRIEACFGAERIRKILLEEGLEPKQYVVERMRELDGLTGSIREYLDGELEGLHRALFQDLTALTQGWDARYRRALLVRYLGFPFWDVLLYPVQALSDVGERDWVNVVRMSPRDARLLKPPPGTRKVKGAAFHHFGAFFSRPDRENDYLWGRLDGAERLIGIVLGKEHPGYADWCKRAFAAILDEEAASLPHVASLVQHLRSQIGSVPKEG